MTRFLNPSPINLGFLILPHLTTLMEVVDLDY